MTASGAVRARTFFRRPDSEKWSVELLDVKASVLQPNMLDPSASRIGIKAPVHLPDRPVDAPEGPPISEDNIAKPRSFKIYPGDLEKYGFTLGCPGCDAVIYKTDRRGHLDRCRSRLEKAMKEDPLNAHRVASTSERFNQYFARRIEEDEAPPTTSVHAQSGVDGETRNTRPGDPNGSDPPTKRARLASNGVGFRNRGLGIPLSSTPPKRVRLDTSNGGPIHAGDDSTATPSQPSVPTSADHQPDNDDENLLLDMLFVSGGESWKKISKKTSCDGITEIYSPPQS